MIKLGWFRELRHGDADGPSIVQSKDQLQNYADEIATYLANGTVIAETGGTLAYDYFDGGVVIGPLRMQTDGTYIWPSDLAYYVRKYRVGLPDEFRQAAARSAFVPKVLSDDEFDALVAEMIGPRS